MNSWIGLTIPHLFLINSKTWILRASHDKITLVKIASNYLNQLLYLVCWYSACYVGTFGGSSAHSPSWTQLHKFHTGIRPRQGLGHLDELSPSWQLGCNRTILLGWSLATSFFSATFLLIPFDWNVLGSVGKLLGCEGTLLLSECVLGVDWGREEVRSHHIDGKVLPGAAAELFVQGSSRLTHSPTPSLS